MLSFIVPVYHPNLKILEKCVKSLLDQSLQDWEAIFVTDGPEPEAVNLIRKLFKKSKNHFKIIEIEHGGACKARNEGAKHAKGEYWVFWDSDCYIEPHAAKAWIDQLTAHPEIGFVYSGYKFSDEKGGIASESFDPWLLRVTNYISTCFPFRKELFPGWNEDLESLQDWDFWLSIVERGAVGKFLVGYAFSTEYPTAESISGNGCTPEKWLERMDKVKKIHNIAQRDICVTSVSDKHEAIRLAKAIGADYLDRPAEKPNHYKTIIQVGFSLNPAIVEYHASAWGPEHKKFIFWTKDNVIEAYNNISQKALNLYSESINRTCTQFVEDLKAQELMTKCGFKTEVLPLPLVNAEKAKEIPEKPKFLVDIDPIYGNIFGSIDASLPDIELVPVGGVQNIEDYSGMLYFCADRTTSQSVKRMLLTGRHVISNLQNPYTGFIEDRGTDEKFIVEIVEKVRALIKRGKNIKAISYYETELCPKKLMDKLIEAPS